MSALYDKARKKFADADIDWLVDTIKVMLIDTGAYTVNLATHEFLSDVPGGAITATSPALTGKTSTDGVCDADDTAFATVSGPKSEALIVFKDTGVAGTSPLIAYINMGDGLPLTPTGINLLVAWDNDPTKKIFKL